MAKKNKCNIDGEKEVQEDYVTRKRRENAARVAKAKKSKKKT